MTTRIRRSFLTSAFGASVLTLSLLVAAVGPASASTPQAPSGFTVDPSGQPTQNQYASMRDALQASSLPRTETVSGATRTFTYLLPSGSTLVLSEPASGYSGGDLEQPQLGIGGCGWFNICIYLNRVDQGAVAAGSAFIIAAAICAIPGIGWISCAAWGATLTVAAFYIASYGFCDNLQIGINPPGSELRCV